MPYIIDLRGKVRSAGHFTVLDAELRAARSPFALVRLQSVGRPNAIYNVRFDRGKGSFIDAMPADLSDRDVSAMSANLSEVLAETTR